MKVIIPPAIRRIMQAYPPIKPNAIRLPAPPAPPPTIDYWSVVGQVLGVFIVVNLVLRFSPLLGIALLTVGLVFIVVKIVVILRQQTRPNQKQENEYLQALAIYAQGEKIYHDRLAEEHSPSKVRAYRQQQLVAETAKLPPLDFAPSDHPFSLPPSLEGFDGQVFYRPRLTIPGMEYSPQFILQNPNKTITIVIDHENHDQELITTFLSQRGVIAILLTQETELASEELRTELNHIWQTIGP